MVAASGFQGAHGRASPRSRPRQGVSVPSLHEQADTRTDTFNALFQEHRDDYVFGVLELFSLEDFNFEEAEEEELREKYRLVVGRERPV